MTSGEATNGSPVRPIIELSGVTKVYGMGTAQMTALGGVDLSIYPGEFVAVMGPSGSGKSTCMNILGCLDTPTDGSYRFCGVEVGKLTRNQRALLRRHYLGFVFQGYNLLNRTSALENVELPLMYTNTPARERRERAMKALLAVGLAGREEHQPSQLSGGQQQRVAIARALVNDPKIILADEPTGALDSRISMEIMAIFQRLNRQDGITMIVVTHDPDVASYSGRLIRVKDGRLHADEPNAEPRDAQHDLEQTPADPEAQTAAA